MKRRAFIEMVAGAAASVASGPLSAFAQQPAPQRVGFLHSASQGYFAQFAGAVRKGLAEAGFAEGQNLEIDYRWAEGQYDRLPALAADLVERRVSAILAMGGTDPARAAKAATSTIPIVFVSAADPVQTGLVASLGRPGGNVTGVSLIASALDAKKLGLLHELVPKAMVAGDATWFRAETATRWMVPVAVRNMYCAGRNFGRHKEESLGYWSKQGVASGIHFDFPTGFIQLPHTIVPHRATVKRPPDVSELDYEVEVAAVIGKPAERVSEALALDCVFGYTVFNDLSAREWQRKEMRNQMILLGKNFPGFGPLGPWILTADEVPDPSQLVLDLKVNGRTLQHASCADMIFGFPQLISFWSKAGLDAGDVIASGTPEGVAMHRKPDPFEFYLKPGDVVHASVEGIGVLETRIA
mgnify:CR=1 FL=1